MPAMLPACRSAPRSVLSQRHVRDGPRKRYVHRVGAAPQPGKMAVTERELTRGLRRRTAIHHELVEGGREPGPVGSALTVYEDGARRRGQEPDKPCDLLIGEFVACRNRENDMTDSCGLTRLQFAIVPGTARVVSAQIDDCPDSILTDTIRELAAAELS